MCDQLASYLKKFVVEAEAAEEEEKKDLSGALEGFKPLAVSWAGRGILVVGLGGWGSSAGTELCETGAESSCELNRAQCSGAPLGEAAPSWSSGS